MGKTRPVGDDVMLQNMAAIRAGVQAQLKGGGKLCDLAALIAERDGQVTVAIVPRKAVRLKGSPSPSLEAAVKRVAKDGRNQLPVLINLPITRTVLWFDYEAFENSGAANRVVASDSGRKPN